MIRSLEDQLLRLFAERPATAARPAAPPAKAQKVHKPRGRIAKFKRRT
jgi:hypothetical protein